MPYLRKDELPFQTQARFVDVRRRHEQLVRIVCWYLVPKQPQMNAVKVEAERPGGQRARRVPLQPRQLCTTSAPRGRVPARRLYTGQPRHRKKYYSTVRSSCIRGMQDSCNVITINAGSWVETLYNIQPSM